MRILSKITGSIIAVVFCVITAPTALFYPEIQIDAVFNSRVILEIVRSGLVDSASVNRCMNELVLVCLVFLLISIILATGFYKLKISRSIALFLLPIFLTIQFYILQTPFFIFMAGTLYNCRVDGQTILGIMVSSPIVGIIMIPFGVVFDLVNPNINGDS